MSFRSEVWPVLDVAFGFFVWAGHLLAIYITTALWCRFEAGDGTLRVLLVGATLAALAVVGVHALRRYRADRDEAERRFRVRVTLAGDGLASLAIAAQLLAITLVPTCV